jgi:hypothetical protein
MNNDMHQCDDDPKEREIIVQTPFEVSTSNVPNVGTTMSGVILNIRKTTTTEDGRDNERCTSRSIHSNGNSKESSGPQYNNDSRMQDIRDRNRTTHKRRKAYVHELQAMVESLQSERNEEIRQRLFAEHRMNDVQTVRRNVMATFLNYHACYQTDVRKWSMILEDTFWLKQPITPFRSFRRSEIEKECRVSRGLEAIINDSASLSVMLESIGCHSSRWIRIKREKFLQLEESRRCPSRKKPSCVERQDSRLQHAVSSLTTSSDSSRNREELNQIVTTSHCNQNMTNDSISNHNKVSSSSGGSGGSGGSGSDGGTNGSNDVHNYQHRSILNKRKNDISSPDESPVEDTSDTSSHGTDNKRHTSSDLSSSEYDSDRQFAQTCRKTDSNGETFANFKNKIRAPTNVSPNGNVYNQVHQESSRISSSNVIENRNDTATNGPHVIATDVGDGSSDSDSSTIPKIKGRYHFNDDEIMITDDVLMCPFVFRTQNAVLCGAMAECVMPGMLRARFSDCNKLHSIELIYDAMGFMQQLERASGNDSTTHVIPGSLDMALSPNGNEGRVITLAHPPYSIVNVNEVWTRITGYTQMENEGHGYLQLIEGDATIADAKNCTGKPIYSLEYVSNGQPACSTNIHYDRNGRDFIEFVCSYPLTNSMDEITHILHVSRELPSFFLT